MSIYQFLQKNKKEILDIAFKHGACNIRVFGSVAREEDTSESDIDFLVDTTSNISFFFPGGLIIDLENFLGRKVDIVIESALKPQLRKSILQDAKPL